MTKLNVTTIVESQQPLKVVNYQDLTVMSELVDQLKSWQEPLNLLQHFFADTDRPINKKKVVRDYHACSQLFNLFQDDFANSIAQIEGQINELKKRKKVY